MCFMVITPALKGIALSNRSDGLVETGLCGAGLSMAARPAWCLVDLVLSYLSHSTSFASRRVNIFL